MLARDRINRDSDISRIEREREEGREVVGTIQRIDQVRNAQYADFIRGIDRRSQIEY
jgi:hypothetical protein